MVPVAAGGGLGADVSSPTVRVRMPVVGLQAPHGRAGAGNVLRLLANPLGVTLGILQLWEAEETGENQT